MADPFQFQGIPRGFYSSCCISTGETMPELRSLRQREGWDLTVNNERFRPGEEQARRRHHDHVLSLQSEPQAKTP